ncbi:MAG: cytochrome c [Actinomycetota bacterium]
MNMRRITILAAGMALALAACGGGSADTTSPGPAGPGDIAAGADVYKGTCAACHSKDLSGISGLGSPLAPSDFVSQATEVELADFIAEGRESGDPENTTGIAMPAKGGNSSLNNQDLRDLAAYLKSEN